MEVTDEGMFIAVNLVQSENEASPIDVTVEGMVTESNPVPRKALVLIAVITDGKVNDFKLCFPDPEEGL